MCHGMSHRHLMDIMLVFLGFGLCFGFAFAIRDMIGHGMVWGDVTTNSFAFSHESC